MNFSLTAFTNAAAEIGRGVVFQSLYWDGVADFAPTHLGETLGAIVLNPNEKVSVFTTPEISADAPRKGYVDGAAPTITVPLYIGDPTKRAILSPTGSASMGHTRRRPVTYRTLVVFPEQLAWDPAFANPDGSLGAYKVIAYTTAGGWTVNGIAASAEQLRLLGHTIWAWRGWFERPNVNMDRGDADAAVQDAIFRVAIDDTKPDGHQLITIGNPITAGILIDVA